MFRLMLQNGRRNFKGKGNSLDGWFQGQVGLIQMMIDVSSDVVRYEMTLDLSCLFTPKVSFWQETPRARVWSVGEWVSE